MIKRNKVKIAGRSWDIYECPNCGLLTTLQTCSNCKKLIASPQAYPGSNPSVGLEKEKCKHRWMGSSTAGEVTCFLCNQSKDLREEKG